MLNFESPKINAWLKLNQLSLNVNKTNFLFFTKTKQKIFPQINDCKIKQANCVKYLRVLLDDKLAWKKHIEHIETKSSAAFGAIYKLRKYIPQKALMSVYYSLVDPHLQYAIICWRNFSKTIKHKLQVKQNRIIKTLCNKFGTKIRLKPLYEQPQVLNIDDIYKLEVAKFMAKINLNKIPVFCSNQSTSFRTLSSIHTYSTRSVSSQNFYVQRTSLVKTNQSLKISGVKIWNSFPGHIRDKVLTSSDKTSSKILKLYFLKSRTCL